MFGSVPVVLMLLGMVAVARDVFLQKKSYSIIFNRKPFLIRLFFIILPVVIIHLIYIGAGS